MNRLVLNFVMGSIVLGLSLPSQANDFLGMHLDCPSVSNECMEIEFFGDKHEKVMIKKDPEMILGPNDLAEAYMSKGQYGQDEVSIALTPNATDQFRKLTSSLVGKRLVVVAHQKALMAPVVQVPINDGRMVFTAGADREFKYLEALPWLKKMVETKKENEEKTNLTSMIAFLALALLVLGGSIYFVFIRKA